MLHSRVGLGAGVEEVEDCVKDVGEGPAGPLKGESFFSVAFVVPELFIEPIESFSNPGNKVVKSVVS